ncbi:hypothetical protein Hanom_Chr02g00111291 [Helianthus anomalus]
MPPTFLFYNLFTTCVFTLFLLGPSRTFFFSLSPIIVAFIGLEFPFVADNRLNIVFKVWLLSSLSVAIFHGYANFSSKTTEYTIF